MLHREKLEAIVSEAGVSEKVKEEAQKLLAKQHDEIAKYAEAMREEMASKAKLEEELQKMEARVLHGGVNLVDKMSQLKQMEQQTLADLDVQRCVVVVVALVACFLLHR
jgi:kinesin family protein 3/17